MKFVKSHKNVDSFMTEQPIPLQKCQNDNLLFIRYVIKFMLFKLIKGIQVDRLPIPQT